jgi:hypothetical protein
MKHTWVLLFPLVLAACSHPLEIEGEGDIVSTGRAIYCTLEQQPCPNIVFNDYIRTYVGLPRPGWDFDHWVNCGTQHPNCSFNIPASVVNQFWGQTMPPLRAVFSLVPQQALTDTGITFGGSSTGNLGNNPDCNAFGIRPQDCRVGRDATHNLDGDGHAGFSYTKLASDGSELPAGAGSWSCVRDNITGRVWEVKTDDGGIHDKDNTYRWGGVTAQGAGLGTYYTDWDVLVNGSNSEVLCGFTDWRVPTPQELRSLVDMGRSNPAIDTAYFPNTLPQNYWSASPSLLFSPNSAWNVNFNLGHQNSFPMRTELAYVRLVRSDG